MCRCKGCKNNDQSLEENEDKGETDDINDSEYDNECGEYDEKYNDDENIDDD